MIKKLLFLIFALPLIGVTILLGNPFKVDGTSVLIRDGKSERTFAPHFTIIYSKENPTLVVKPAAIERVQYNVPVWNTTLSEFALKDIKRKDDQFGDGFDDAILNNGKKMVTANLYAAGEITEMKAEKVLRKGKLIFFEFRPSPVGMLCATIDFSKVYPILSYTFTPLVEGYFSVGYTGAPSFCSEEVETIWQPLVWQERRIPSQPFMTLAYRTPVPTTLATKSGVTVGVVAHPSEFPFDSLPTMKNSRFGVALLNAKGEVQPQLFSPVLGGKGSKMKAGKSYSFKACLYVKETSCSQSFEKISREIYQFKDYRRNTQVSLNTTLDNMIDYGMSDYSLFIDSLKGCNYSTDAPGAVKNVSSLNPLQIALLTGRKDIYEKRAYPMVEYALSRDKFLFSLDPKQRIQYPSRLLTGPCAPISELLSLYSITLRSNPYLIDLARHEYNTSRVRNLDKEDRGNTWQNAAAIYRATQDKSWLAIAMEGADKYLNERVNRYQTDFLDKDAQFFFWTGFTPDWVGLTELYELTGKKRYLDAAHKAIRQYAMFVWFAPSIPDSVISVNKNGFAPHYAYLKGKGYSQMKAAPENVEAWRLSEIGLTPESSGTSTGHRGIFLTNYAPWMLRVGFLTDDKWLQDIARSAVIGRYANFPGYHINTARTTIYEKENYPYQKYNELSVNSFHFNHIWPHMNVLTDYLVTDALVKSRGKITFPSQFVEGFAYLQSKFYGQLPGQIYNYKDVNLYLPQRLMTINTQSLNHIAGYNKEYFFLVFTNQSTNQQTARIQLNDSIFGTIRDSNYSVEVWMDNKKTTTTLLSNGKVEITVSPSGITVLAVKGLSVNAPFREEFQVAAPVWETPYGQDKESGLTAMLIGVGKHFSNLYAYVNKDDTGYVSATLQYAFDGAEWKTVDKTWFPFEFTVPIASEVKSIRLKIIQTKANGVSEESAVMELKH